MNCSDFERIINDLARDQVMEATARTSGLAHMESCARCAASLADERSLTVGLRSLAASAEHLEAPAHVEATLLAAFREREKIIQLKPATRIANPRQRWRSRAAGIAAAVMLLFVVFAASRMRHERSTPQAMQAINSTSNAENVASSAGARDSQLSGLPVLSSGQRDQDAPGIEPAPLRNARAQQSRLAIQRTPNRTRNSTSGSGGVYQAVGSPQPVNVAADTNGDDIATDFIPLTYGGNLNGMDSGRVVRVELPRTALARFGFPLNTERAGEPVKADVLLGEDGLAQAIRFVR
jgi:hypothetical protein